MEEFIPKKKISDHEIIDRAVQVVTQCPEELSEDKDVLQAKMKLLKCVQEVTQSRFGKFYDFNLEGIDEFGMLAEKNVNGKSDRFSEFVI